MDTSGLCTQAEWTTTERNLYSWTEQLKRFVLVHRTFRRVLWRCGGGDRIYRQATSLHNLNLLPRLRNSPKCALCGFGKQKCQSVAASFIVEPQVFLYRSASRRPHSSCFIILAGNFVIYAVCGESSVGKHRVHSTKAQKPVYPIYLCG